MSQEKTKWELRIKYSQIARTNQSDPDFKLGTNYHRNDVRRFLTTEQRKQLSLDYNRGLKCGHSFGAYRAFCKSIYRFGQFGVRTANPKTIKRAVPAN